MIVAEWETAWAGQSLSPPYRTHFAGIAGRLQFVYVFCLFVPSGLCLRCHPNIGFSVAR
jgi:hypothetical protein